MSFFDSEVVRAEMVEIQELQDEVYKNVFGFPSMDSKEKLHHIDLLERLIDKQKTAYEMLRSLVGSEMCIRDRCIYFHHCVSSLLSKAYLDQCR